MGWVYNDYTGDAYWSDDDPGLVYNDYTGETYQPGAPVWPGTVENATDDYTGAPVTVGLEAGSPGWSAATGWSDETGDFEVPGAPTETSPLEDFKKFATSDAGKAIITGLSGILGSYFNSKNPTERSVLRSQIATAASKVMDPAVRERFLSSLDEYDAYIRNMPPPGLGERALNVWEPGMRSVEQYGALPNQLASRAVYERSMPYSELPISNYLAMNRVGQELESPEYMAQIASQALRDAGWGLNRGTDQAAMMSDIVNRNAALKAQAAALYGQSAQIPLSISSTLASQSAPYGETFNPATGVQYAMVPETAKRADIAATAPALSRSPELASLLFPHTGSTTGTETADRTISKPAAPNWFADSLKNLFGTIGSTYGLKLVTEPEKKSNTAPTTIRAGLQP